MMTSALVCCLAFLSFSVLNVDAITNGELYEILKSSLNDVEEYDILSSDDVTLDDDDDSISLPGNENDEADMEYLIEKLGFYDLANDKSVTSENHQIVGGPCTCRRNTCRCCAGKTFSVKVVWKKVKATLNACLTVAYLPRNFGFMLTFELNGRRMYNKEISLKHPPALCYKIPGLGKYARACLELYDINLGAKSLCARVKGVIDLKIKKFSYSLKIACFKIPILEQGKWFDELTPAEMTSEDSQLHNIAELLRIMKNGELNNDE